MANEQEFWNASLLSDLPQMPILVIRQAASGLAPITKGLVEAVIFSENAADGYLGYGLYLQAPTIKYSVRIASFQYKVAKHYPVYASLSGEVDEPLPGGFGPLAIIGTKTSQSLDTESDLREYLKWLLRSSGVSEMVRGLMATLTQSVRTVDSQAA